MQKWNKRKHKGLRDKKAYCFEAGERLGYKEILEKFRHYAPLYGINLKDVNAIGATEPNLLAYQSYSYKVLRQLLDTYRELEQEGESKNINARDDAESNLISGRTLAYYCVLERFRTYAKLFGIPLKEIGLAKIIPLF